MKLFSLILLVLAAFSLIGAQEVSTQDDSPSGLVVVKVKRERRQQQPTDLRHTATDPDALQNTSMMPGGGGSNFPTFVFEYSAEIKNDSPKAVKWLTLMYVLTDSENKQELDRREFSSFDKIGAGQKKTATGIKRLEAMKPSGGDVKNKNGTPNDQRVQFVCVAFDDGTLWHAAFIPESHCRDIEKRGKSR
jgi:hypothetical protein